MIEVAALTALLLATTPTSPESVNGFATPSPGVIEQLRRQNSRQDWLRVKMSSTQMVVRARLIDEQGLGDLRARGSDRRPLAAYTSDPSSRGYLPWSSISRIDGLRTQSRKGRIAGFVAVGILGAANVGRPALGALFGGLAGAWLGGRIGAQFVKTSPLYLAQPLPEPSSIASATPEESAAPSTDSLAMATDTTAIARESVPSPEVPPASAQVREPAPTPRIETPPPSPAALRAYRSIGPKNLLQIEADFGRFQGYALRPGPEGLDELRADPNANLAPAPRGLVAWDRIDRLSKRGNSAGKAALSGGAAFGLLGGMLGAAAASVVNGNATPTTAFMGGALAGGAFGAVLGGLIGTAFPAWHVIYRRPADALRASRR